MPRIAGLLLVLLIGFSAAFVGVPGLLTAGAVATPTPPPLPPTRTPIPPTATARPLPTLAPTATPLPMDAPELRAIWADAFHDGFKTPEQVDHLVAWARAANANALFVQVRRRGDAYYLQSLEPQAEDLEPGFDALAYLLERAHQGPQRLQVHAWLATLPIWPERDTPPISPAHVFNRYGPTAEPSASWLMTRDDGETWAGVGKQGTYYLDPGNPDAARYTSAVYVNLVRNYDVDGIHLDQVRYYEGQPLRWGYNPTSVARFNAQFERDPETQPDPTDAEWISWRRAQVTNLVRHIYLEAHAIRPRIVISAAVVTWGKGPQGANDWEQQAPYASVMQDWRAWLQEGIVDYLLPMNYYRESGEQADWFDTWTRWQTGNPGKRGVVLGMGSYLNTADGVLAQLGRARALGTLGVALYSYAVPTRDLEDASDEDRMAFAEQLRSVFTRPAPVPDLAWLSRPSTGAVLVDIPGHADVSVLLDGGGTRRLVWRTDGTGLAGGVDVLPGHYVLTVSGPGLDSTPIDVQVLPGQTAAVRFAPGHVSGSS